MQQLLVVLFFAIFCAGCFNQKSPKEALEKKFNGPFYGRLVYDDQLIDPRPQEISERIFEDSATQIVRQFAVHPLHASEDSDTVVMTTPARAVIDEKEQFLFLIDSDSNAVHKFSLNTGRLLAISTEPADRKLGNQSVYMYMMGNEELWFTGVESKKIMRTDLDGSYLDMIDLPYSGWVAPASSGEFVFLDASNMDELFHVYSSKGKKQRSFGILSSIEHEIHGRIQQAHGMGFIGELRTEGDHTFVYTSFFGGGILGYTMDGTLRYFRETIDSGPFPRLRSFTEEEQEKSGLDAGDVTVDTDQVISQQFSMNVWNGIFYQNTYLLSDQETFVVDAYDYDTGDYLFSIPSPEGCGIIFITDRHLYASCLEQGFFQIRRPASLVNPADEPDMIQAHLAR